MNLLFTNDSSRYVLFPIKDKDIWSFYKNAQASFWTAEEIDLAQDVSDWETLTENEKHFISSVLAFFAASDGIVNENLVERFCNDVKLAEARAFYGFQIAIENIHSEVYSLLIDTLIQDETKKTELFDSINTMPCVAKKAEWAMRWIDSQDSFAKRLIAFACVEGIFFSSSFCSIYWLKKRNLMPGLAFSNELIARDEGMHTDFACLLYHKLDPEQKISKEDILQIVDEAVNIEHEFVTDSIPVELIGMNSKLMCRYVQFCADRLLVSLGLNKHYLVSNPFEFMEHISLQNKTNFFEARVGAYQKAGVSIQSSGQKAFNLDEEF